MRQLTPLAACCALLACGDGGSTQLSQEQRQTIYIDGMKDVVRQRLKDPSSAEFRGVFFSQSGGVQAVCGEVNSKNTMGGYTGFQKFIAAGELAFLEEEMEADAITSTWARFCAR